MKLRFTKMSGAGNDFILLGPEYAPLAGRLSEIARAMCPSHVAVGADGLILVERTGSGLFMHYVNSDGSEASFCGNGARCLVLYCGAKGIASGRVTFRSKSGVHVGEVVPEGIKVDMKAPSLVREITVAVAADGPRQTDYHVHLVDAGVPHAVIFADDVDSVDVEGLGRRVRHHAAFGPEGANVDFIDSSGREPFRLRTYERGVEQETLACGSGCLAGALVLRLKHLAGDSVSLRVTSGDVLTVGFSPDGQAGLTGPAAIVFEGEMDLKELDHV